MPLDPGIKFGKLTVIKRDTPIRRKPNGAPYVHYQCMCDCGNTHIVEHGALVSGLTKSCGCAYAEAGIKRMHYKSGDQVGSLTLVSYSRKKWVALCECGNTCAKTLNQITELTGLNCGCKSREIQRHTLKNRYGVENPSQIDAVKEKKKRTCLANHGVEYPSQNSDILAKQHQTMLKKYGVKFASQSNKIRLEQARQANRSYICEHWETGEQLVCQGVYEYNVCIFLNANRQRFIWQPEPFRLSNGRTYACDMLLIDTQIYVEIKGYWYKDALEKFTMFRAEYPDLNVEVWDTSKLKILGIPISIKTPKS